MMKKNCSILILLLSFGAVSAQIQISEIAWMGTAGSSYDEWIELYNIGEEELDLENWQLSSVDGTPNIKLSGNISAKSYFLLERTDDTTLSNVDADQIYTGSLSNSGESLILKNGNEIIDQTPLGEWIAGENSAKKSMERKNFTISGLQTDAWQTFQDEGSPFRDVKDGIMFGTPKSKNSGEIIIPLPKNLEFVSDFEKVEITKITPVILGSGEAWLEFSILSDSAVDITDWTISNETSLQKLSEMLINNKLISKSENLAGKSIYLNNQGLAKIPEQNLAPNFILEENRLIFSAKNEGDLMTFAVKSPPLSLDNNNSFNIKNNDEILSEKVFAKELQIIISEVSPNNIENDFFELFVKDSDEIVDLKFMEILHNGKTLFFTENSLLVEKGDLLSFELLSEKTQERPSKYRNTTFLQETGDSFVWEKSAKNGIVSSSGTMEIKLWSGTSWQRDVEIADFVCWADKNLNKTETKRLEQNSPQNWRGDCFQSDKLSKNESFARSEPQTDTNSSRDFYHHLHGSLGQKNFIKNHKPRAKIKLQSGKFSGKSRVNFTGLEKDNSASTDGDGLNDLVKFQWKINGKSCGNYEKDNWNWDNEHCYLESQKKNPSYMYFNFDGEESFEISLRVTDLAGFSDTSKIIISRDIVEEITKENSDRTFNYDKDKAPDNFFTDFLANTDLVKLKEIAYSDNQPTKIKSAPRYLFARDKFTAEQKSRIAKNIGLIFQ